MYPRENMWWGFQRKFTDEQEAYLDAIFQKQLIMVNALAGTGKTTLAIMAAKVLGMPMRYIFFPVEEDKLGFTPGGVEEKESKYLQPLKDALGKMGERPEFAIHSENNPDHINKGTWIQAHSHVFARGTNYENCFVVIDEAQNGTISDLRKVLTRIHDNCKVVVIGHDKQCDLKDPKTSGFVPYLTHFEGKPYAAQIELTKNFRGRLSRDADLIG